MEIVRKIIDGKKETTITHLWEGPAATVWVKINDGIGEGNGGCHFSLEIEGGQVEFISNPNGGILSMDGEWERKDFTELLKQIIVELELIDGK